MSQFSSVSVAIAINGMVNDKRHNALAANEGEKLKINYCNTTTRPALTSRELQTSRLGLELVSCPSLAKIKDHYTACRSFCSPRTSTAYAGAALSADWLVMALTSLQQQQQLCADSRHH